MAHDRTNTRPFRTAAIAGCLGLALAGSAVMTSGCDKQTHRQPEGAAVMPATDSPAKTEKPRAPVDMALFNAVEAAAKTCSLTESGRLECIDSKPRLELARQFNLGERDCVAALPTMVELLSTNNPVTSVVVSELLATGFGNGFGKDAKKGDVSSETTQGLIEAYSRFDEYRAHRIVPATTHAAVLSGDARRFHEAMVERKDLQGIYRMVQRLMIHGRLEMLDLVKVALDAKEDLALSLAGLEAMRYMADWSAEEQEVLCPIVLEHIGPPPVPMSARAAQTYIHCNGPHLGALLEKMRAQLAAKELPGTELIALYGRCRDAKDGADAEECQTVVAFLESIAADKQQPAELRTAALDHLAAQLPTENNLPEGFDEALAQRVVRKLGKDRNPAVAEAAKRVTATP